MSTPKSRLSLALFAFVLVAAPPPVVAQTSSEGQSLLKSLFFRLPGNWQGEGVVGGNPSRIEMSWAPVLDGRFMRVTWRNVMTTRDGSEQRFEGEGTYRPIPDGAGVLVGTWFDSQGALHPLAGTMAGDSLVTRWGRPDGALGRTTYRLLDANTLRVRDELQRGTSWLTFGISTFQRAPAPAH